MKLLSKSGTDESVPRRAESAPTAGSTPTRGPTRRSIIYPVTCALLFLAAAPPSTLWRIDNLERIDGHPVRVEGSPVVIDTPAGKAVQFHGGKDALFLDAHPLAFAASFTWEVVFRPDPDGSPEQRFFHFQVPGEDTRLLFEIRIRQGRWCLDSYANSRGTGQALMNTARLHPLGVWHHAAAVYDGAEYRNYVDGELEGSAAVRLEPQGAGQCAIGTRFNRRDYFKGAILLSRMTPRTLSPAEFLKVPDSLRPR
jgi:hypothetical protein